jgi:signal transduction histidine kinase
MNRVLCVDDEPNVLESLRRALRKRYQIETAASAMEGLQAIEQRGPYSVIVTDMRMPGLDGSQFLARVREVAPDSIRIMLTGDTDRETAILAINEGHIFRFLTKPCTTEAISEALDAGVKQYNLQQAEKQLAEAERRYHEAIDLANRELEARVADRTRELTSAIEQLQDESNERRRTEEALRESEERLRQSQKLESLGRLAGGVAHDFNNLLTAIIGFSDLLLLKAESAQPERHHIEEIKKAGERAASLTRQLLAFSRCQVLQPTVVDLNMVVADMSKMLRQLISEEIKLTHTLDTGPKCVTADRGQLEQAIINLVLNARDAIRGSGEISIATSSLHLAEDLISDSLALLSGDYVILEVNDNGSGMSPEVLGKIFDPFFTTKEPGKGTGLGLSTVYGIVRQSGGQISVQSEEGRGTIFKLYFPESIARAEELTDDASSQREMAENETVLLVEDEKTVRDLAGTVLRMHGYVVIEAVNGLDALKVCADYRGPIHLLLTDMVMPQMGGRELSTRLAECRPATKVLFMSGYTEDEILRKCAAPGNARLVAKPFTPNSLLKSVRDVLNSSAGAEQLSPQVVSEIPGGAVCNDRT